MLDTLREMIAQSGAGRLVGNERNERNEQTPHPPPLNSFNSFLSSPKAVDRAEFEKHAEVPRAEASDPLGAANRKSVPIVEFGGGVPRSWSEGFARLHPDRPPGDVPLKRWQQFMNDIGRFLDAGWAEKASALGWRPLDLFGCDLERPFARIDHAGLLWLLNGDRLAELDHHRAVIERRTGSRQVFRRRPGAVGEVVLAWELVADHVVSV
jgi:hypothetical protein